MAFNIKVYAGTASNTANMYQKIIQGMTTVFGYAKTSGAVTGQGWEVISADGGNSKYFLKSKDLTFYCEYQIYCHKKSLV